MIIFEAPQSSRASMKVTLERSQSGLIDVDLDEMKLLNPYCLLVTIPSKSTTFFMYYRIRNSIKPHIVQYIIRHFLLYNYAKIMKI